MHKRPSCLLLRDRSVDGHTRGIEHDGPLHFYLRWRGILIGPPVRTKMESSWCVHESEVPLATALDNARPHVEVGSVRQRVVPIPILVEARAPMHHARGCDGVVLSAQEWLQHR